MQLPFVTDSYRGEVPINWYPAADSEKGAILFGTPGLEEFAAHSGYGEVRAVYPLGGNLYVVAANLSAPQGSTIFKLSLTGSTVSGVVIGQIPSYKSPIMTIDNGRQLMFVDNAWGYTYDTQTGAFGPVVAEGFPGACAAGYIDGFGLFVQPDTQRFYITGFYDFTTTDALDFASAEGLPDNLVSLLVDHREVWLFGTVSTEIWYNSGAQQFPLERIPGGFIEEGCAAVHSPAKGDNSLYWLSEKRQILRAEGYQPLVVSSKKMEREIEKYSKVDDAVAFCYTEEGHAFYQITFPTADKTWVFDAATRLWHKRSSYPSHGTGRHRANCYAKWNGFHLVGDYRNGTVYRLGTDVLYENSTADGPHHIERILDTQEMRSEGARQFFPGIQIEFDASQANENELGPDGRGLVTGGEDPKAMLQFSNDGGETWSNEIWVSVGKVGEYMRRAIWRRLGSAFSRIFRIRVSDPIKWVILSMNRMPAAEDRRKAAIGGG